MTSALSAIGPTATVLAPSLVSRSCRARSHCNVQPDPLTGSTQMNATFNLLLGGVVEVPPQAATTNATAKANATILASLMLSPPFTHAGRTRAPNAVILGTAWRRRKACHCELIDTIRDHERRRSISTRSHWSGRNRDPSRARGHIRDFGWRSRGDHRQTRRNLRGSRSKPRRSDPQRPHVLPHAGPVRNTPGWHP